MNGPGPQTPAPHDALDSMYEILGRHPVCRAGHAKGAFCGGTFTPLAEAGELTDAPHMQRDPVDVTVRFSNVTGNPDRPDGARNARGMAVRFHLPDNGYSDLIAVSLPCFTNRRPADFVAMNYACFTRRDGTTRARPLGTLRFVRDHRESFKGMWAGLRIKPVASYASCRYNSLNAFVWTKQEEGSDERPGCYVRYSWIPAEGERSLDKRAAKRRPPDFLQRDLYQRIGRMPAEPIRFSLEVQIASTEDKATGRVEDPTRPWPREPGRIVPAPHQGLGVPVGEDGRRDRVLIAGMLELTHLTEGPATDGDAFGFNPLNLTQGIEPSNDPILAFRPEVYDIAARERVAGIAGHP